MSKAPGGHEWKDTALTDRDTGGLQVYVPDCENLPAPGPWDEYPDPWVVSAPLRPAHPLFGTPTTDAPPVTDAGLSELVSSAREDDRVIGEWPVDGAVVINVGTDPSRSIWLQDSHEAIRVQVADGLSPVPVPGNIVRFTATAIDDVHGDIAVTQLAGWELDDDIEPVQVIDVLERALGTQDRGRNIRVYGFPGGTGIANCDLPTGGCIPFDYGPVWVYLMDPTGGVAPLFCHQLVAPATIWHVGRERLPVIDLGNPAWARAYP